MRLTAPTLFGPVATTIIKTTRSGRVNLNFSPFSFMPELILAKLDHISMLLKLDSLSREIQRILTLTHLCGTSINLLTEFKLE